MRRAARRRAVQPRRAASTRSTTRSASRGRSRPTCRSSSAAPARRRRLRTARAARRRRGTPAARRSTSVRASLDILGEHCADVGRDLGRDRADRQLPDRHPRRPARPPRRPHARAARGRTARRDTGDEPDLARLARAESPTRLAPVSSSSASRRHRPAARRRTTARRSTGCRGVPSCSGVGARPADGSTPWPCRLPGRRRRRGEAGRTGSRPHVGERPDRRRQHRRRHRAPRPARDARTTTRSCTRSPASTNRELGLGHSRARRSRPRRCSSAYGEETLVPARRPGLSRRTSSGPRGCRGGDRLTDVCRALQAALGVAAAILPMTDDDGPDRGPRPTTAGSTSRTTSSGATRRPRSARSASTGSIAARPTREVRRRSSAARPDRHRAVEPASSSIGPDPRAAGVRAAIRRRAGCAAPRVVAVQRDRRRQGAEGARGPDARVARPRGDRRWASPGSTPTSRRTSSLDQVDAALAPAVGALGSPGPRHRHDHVRRRGPRSLRREVLASPPPPDVRA